jgi:hypothetical protein
VWVTAEERALIVYMAEQHVDVINKIKGMFQNDWPNDPDYD